MKKLVGIFRSFKESNGTILCLLIFLFGNFIVIAESGKNHYSLAISYKSNVDGDAQLFYDTGDGFRESESVSIPFSGTKDWKMIYFPLEPGDYQNFRLDPICCGKGRIQYASIALVDPFRREVRRFSLDRISSARDIERAQFKDYVFSFDTDADAADPQLLLNGGETHFEKGGIYSYIAAKLLLYWSLFAGVYFAWTYLRKSHYEAASHGCVPPPIAGCFFAFFTFALLSVANFPGFMSADSLDQYGQAIHGAYNDWHPPVMARVWSVLNVIIPGPQNLLALHLIFLSSAVLLLYMIFYRKDFEAAFLFLLIPYAPWVLIYSGALWKDVGMAYSWLLAVALVLFMQRQGRLNFWLMSASILIFAYGFLLRGNAVFGAVPLLYYYAAAIMPRSGVAMRSACAVIAGILMVFLANIINHQVLGAEPTHPEVYMMVDDLQHISERSGVNLFPAAAKVPDAVVAECSGQVVGAIFCYREKRPNVIREIVEEAYSPLKRAWIQAVVAHPWAYSSSRFDAFVYFIKTPSSKISSVKYMLLPDNTYGIQLNRNVLTDILEGAIDWSIDWMSALYKPFYWLLYGLILFAGTFLVRRTNEVALARYLALSGIFYLLGYLPLVAEDDFRYAYWSVLAETIATCLIVVALRSASRASRPLPT